MPAAARIATSLRLRALDARDRLRPGHDGLVPPRRLRGFVGDSDFVASGEEFLAHFVAEGGLQATDDVLDAGCGIGRMARPLSRFLTSGSYTGFDVSAEAIAWCREHYPPRMRFVHADVHNGMYNPGGVVEAAAFRFPCEDASIHFAFATSLFTHLLADDAAHYLAETGRVLRPGGRALLTFYVDDDRPGGSEDRVSVTSQWLLTALTDAGLTLSKHHPGGWSGRPGALSLQDIVIATKERT